MHAAMTQPPGKLLLNSLLDTLCPWFFVSSPICLLVSLYLYAFIFLCPCPSHLFVSLPPFLRVSFSLFVLISLSLGFLINL